MTTLVRSLHEIEASAQCSPAVASSSKLRSRVVGLWPPTIVALGLGLSIAWTAGLFWLLYAMV